MLSLFDSNVPSGIKIKRVKDKKIGQNQYTDRIIKGNTIKSEFSITSSHDSKI